MRGQSVALRTVARRRQDMMSVLKGDDQSILSMFSFVCIKAKIAEAQNAKQDAPICERNAKAKTKSFLFISFLILCWIYRQLGDYYSCLSLSLSSDLLCLYHDESVVVVVGYAVTFDFKRKRRIKEAIWFELQWEAVNQSKIC